MDEWMYGQSDDADDGPVAEWFRRVDSGEDQEDALLAADDNIPGEGLKLYRKWEPLLRLMCADRVHGS